MVHEPNPQSDGAAKTAETDTRGGVGVAVRGSSRGGGAGRAGALVSAAVGDYSAAMARLKARFLKAHLRRHKGQWVCEAHGVVGYGSTPALAYFHWNSKTRPLQQQWVPAQPIQWPRYDAPSPYTITCRAVQ
jgi:hypothetical protein